MAPNSTIHLIRHAEGCNQVSHDDPAFEDRDAGLTDKGKQQARDFCTIYPYHDTTDLLCASPLRRAIQTAQLAFEPEMTRGLTILAVPHAQEAQAEPADTGCPVSELKNIFESGVDLNLLGENWYVKEDINGTDNRTLRERGRKLRLFLRDRPEHNIVMVTHGIFAHYITEHINANGEQTGEYWQNVMWRTYQFEDNRTDVARLIETKESQQRHPHDDAVK